MFDVIEASKSLGPWGHSYEVSPGVWLGPENEVNWRVPTFQQQLAGVGIDLSKSRILDLACLDGLFCIEYGKLGAEMVGVDIRPENIARAKFGADAAGVKSTTFKVGDVLDLTKDEIGTFDVVLCCGLFYHLMARDCIKLLHIMRSLTTGVCLLDTHISFPTHVIDNGYELTDLMSIEVEGDHYEGRLYREFAENTPMEVRMSMPSSSVANDTSFWFTVDSLTKALHKAGFEVVKTFLPRPDIPLEEQGRPVFLLK